jgi:hypothetical protein
MVVLGRNITIILVRWSNIYRTVKGPIHVLGLASLVTITKATDFSWAFATTS